LPSDEGAATADRVFAAARGDFPLPLGEDRKFRIAIPAEHVMENSAVVRYYAGDRYAVYRFNRRDGAWQRRERIDAGVMPAAAAAVAGAADGYTQLIAVLYNRDQAVRDNDWYINSKTAADRGYNFYSEEYQSDVPFKADFLPGTQVSGDTTYEVRFDGASWWKGKRLTSPRTGDSIMCSGTDPCDFEFQYDSLGHIAWVGAQHVTLRYYLYVVVPVGVSISGPGASPDSIGLEGNYTWTASASGGDGSSFTYQWEQRQAGGAWSNVGSNSPTYSRFVSATEACTTYELRVTATSGGQSGSNTFTYAVKCSIEEPLVPEISGTSAVQTTGSYTWPGSATGGLGTYSYEWEYCQGGNCSVVGTSSSYTRYVAVGDGEFILNLTVTASLGQQQSNTASHYVWVQWGDPCPDCMGPVRRPDR
jgi:hypothetical protein